jgi:predicted NodU family carbamoyl transferase
VQHVTALVAAVAVGDDGVALGLALERLHPHGQRPRQQQVVVVQLGEERRVDQVAAGAERARQVGSLEGRDAHAAVRAEVTDEMGVGAGAVDHQDGCDAD